jgi:hypothetical protein
LCPTSAPRYSPAVWSPEISRTTIWRWLAETRSAQGAPQLDLPRDSGFQPKAARVLDLYAREWQGELLGADE